MPPKKRPPEIPKDPGVSLSQQNRMAAGPPEVFSSPPSQTMFHVNNNFEEDVVQEVQGREDILNRGDQAAQTRRLNRQNINERRRRREDRTTAINSPEMAEEARRIAAEADAARQIIDQAEAAGIISTAQRVILSDELDERDHGYEADEEIE